MPTICTSWPDGGKKWLKSIRFETICSQMILSKLTFSVYSKMFFLWRQRKIDNKLRYSTHRLLSIKLFFERQCQPTTLIRSCKTRGEPFKMQNLPGAIWNTSTQEFSNWVALKKHHARKYIIHSSHIIYQMFLFLSQSGLNCMLKEKYRIVLTIPWVSEHSWRVQCIHLQMPLWTLRDFL